MKPNRCSVSTPSAWTQAGSSAARHTTAARRIFARVDIRIQRVMGLNRQVRQSRLRTYPSMMPGPAASHGNALNAGLDGKKSGSDRPVVTAYKRFLSLSENIHVGDSPRVALQPWR